MRNFVFSVYDGTVCPENSRDENEYRIFMTLSLILSIVATTAKRKSLSQHWACQRIIYAEKGFFILKKK